MSIHTCSCGIRFANVTHLQTHQITCDEFKDDDVVFDDDITQPGNERNNKNNNRDTYRNNIHVSLQSSSTSVSTAEMSLQSPLSQSEIQEPEIQESEIQELMQNYSRFALDSDEGEVGEEMFEGLVNDMFSDDTNAEEFLNMIVRLMQHMGQKLVEKDSMIELLQITHKDAFI